MPRASNPLLFLPRVVSRCLMLLRPVEGWQGPMLATAVRCGTGPTLSLWPWRPCPPKRSLPLQLLYPRTATWRAPEPTATSRTQPARHWAGPHSNCQLDTASGARSQIDEVLTGRRLCLKRTRSKSHQHPRELAPAGCAAPARQGQMSVAIRHVPRPDLFAEYNAASALRNRQCGSISGVHANAMPTLHPTFAS
jgi:hypothetical protein